MPTPAPISYSLTLPRLSPADHALFDLFASSHLDLHTLSEKSGRDLTELTAWAAAPEIRLYTEAYRELAGRGVINTAIAALIETMKATENLVEKRRAAQAVIRAHQTPRRQPQFTIAPAAPPPSPAAGTGGGRGARAAGSEGYVPTPSTSAPKTSDPLQNKAATQTSSPSPPPRIFSHVATSPLPVHSPLPTLLPPLHSPRINPHSSLSSPTVRLTTAAGLAGPAP